MKHEAAAVEKFRAQVFEWGFEVSEEQVSKLVSFSNYLASYTEANVIGTKNSEEILSEHVLDSLSCVKSEAVRTSGIVIDVGSGGGLPGIPLSIVGQRATLLEATAKKVRFLERAVGALQLCNVTVSKERAEEAGRSVELRERYDVATARALAGLDVVAEYCLPFVCVGGSVVAMKGRLDTDEIERGKRATELLGGEISEVITVSRLPEYEQKQRHLVIIRKLSPTPHEYPRRVGIPSKNPLGVRGKV